MRWKGRRESGNVVDKRKKAGGIGLAGLLLGAAVTYMLGGDPLGFLLQNAGNLNSGTGGPSAYSEAQSDELKSFSAVVLADTEDVWNKAFQSKGGRYQEPKMVLFRGQVRTACGSASSAVGPFYCPGDHQVYLDLAFFKELSESLGAQGDFGRAYVIAHEVGHHVQNILGLNQRVRQLQRSMGKTDSNKLSVVMELQADCFAGFWAGKTHQEKNIMEAGDAEEALSAASAVGDDTLQRRSQGQVVPDSFTHGSSAQRMQAFKGGFGASSFDYCLQSYDALKAARRL